MVMIMKMAQLMGDDIVDTLAGRPDQIGIEGQSPIFRQTAPTFFHPAYLNPGLFLR